jgi:hypothetical protein
VSVSPGDAVAGVIEGRDVLSGAVPGGALTGVTGRLGSELAEFGGAALGLVAVTVQVIGWPASAEVSV